MDLLTTAAEYVLGIITENEDVKKFPKEFVGESIKWVKSWFLTPEDPRNTAKLEDPKKDIVVKKDIINDKLTDLQSNPVFMQELAAKLQIYNAEKLKLLNVIDDSEIDVKGNFRQGNTGGASTHDADETNVIKRSKIIIGGDFRQGDDIQQGNMIVNNYHSIDKSKLEEAFISKREVEDGALLMMREFIKASSEIKFLDEAPDAATLNLKKAMAQLLLKRKTELSDLLSQGKTEEVIKQMRDLTETTDADAHKTILLLSEQLNRLKSEKNNGVISFSEAHIERNRLTDALMNVINGLEF